MIDTEVKFSIFGENKGNVGISLKGNTWGCPFVGMVAFKWDDCLLNAKAELDLEGLQGGIVAYKISELKRVGFDIGEWGFGFLGDVTPREDDTVLVFIITDSGHLVWMHTYVE